ncbi:MAG: hypothetical protein RL114_326 [Actinomycetota bacterium]
MNSDFDSRSTHFGRTLRQHGRSMKAALAAILAVSVVLVARWDSPLQAAVKPSVTLEQCANLTTTCDTTHSSNWQTGNLGTSNSDYAEGDSVAYRSIATNLTVGQTYRLLIEWDTTQTAHHAIDYPTSYSRTETTADPCAGVTCSGSANFLTIPIDPNVTSAGVTQLSGQNFTVFGATFPANGVVVSNTGGNLCGTATCTLASNPSAYSVTGTYAGTSTASAAVYFTATNSTAVLAWGGHIASRVDWGAGKSASAMAGSPYHMRVIDFNCSNVDNCSSGNMDRSLSAAAVTLPGSITIVKQATTNGDTSFSFVGAPAPLTSFNLVDDGTIANTKVFSGITTFGSYTVSETSLAGWGLDRASCSVANQTTGTASVDGSTAYITLAEGEDVTCTFYNSPLPAPAMNLQKTANAESYSAVGNQITYTYVLTNTGNTILGPTQFSIDDDKINGGAPFDCGPAETTLLVGETVSCTAVYTVTSGDIENASITNTAFGLVGQLVTPNRQVTIIYIPPATTTTLPVATTTLPIATTTVPIATTTVPIATTTVPVATTVTTPTTTTPVEPQVVNPDNPTGTEDVLDVLIPEVLPAAGWRVGGITLIAALILLLGVGAMTLSSNRRQRKNGGRS